MSKTAIEGLIKLQYEVLNSSDNKDRIKHIIGGVKDGRFYNSFSTDFGEWEGDDCEFITEDDLDVSRLTGARLNQITARMLNYFNTTEEVVEEVVDEVTEDGLEIDVDEVIAQCKKAIKKGKSKKATKLLNFLDEDSKAYKKLSKKIKEI